MSNNTTNTTSAADTVRTDKKANAAYWDAIDDDVFNCITAIAALSLSENRLIFDENEDDNDENATFCDLYGDGIIGEIRDRIIEYLTEQGGDFPFVNENM